MERQDGSHEPVGASPIGAPPKRRPGWLIPLGLLVLLALIVLFLLSQCGNDNSSSAPATPASRSSTTSTGSIGTSTTGIASTATGSVIVGENLLLPTDQATMIGKDGNLSAYVSSSAATATAIRVQSVPADEGFWVGSSDRDRVWVQLTGSAGESPYTVKLGDRVSFTGTVVKNAAGFSATAGVTDAEGKTLLEAQKAHIDVARKSLKLVS